MTDTQVLLSELDDRGVLKLTLNRPKVNAFNYEMIDALQQALKAARKSETRVVLLSGAGRIFSAGQDLTEVKQAEDQSFRYHLQRTYNPLIMQIRRLEKPVLAAIHGAVTGAALGIALACDLRIAAEDTRFVVGFSGIGLAPDSAVSLFLPALIGLGRATEYTFSNAPISAEQALAWGMVNRLAPGAGLPAQALAWAHELADGPVHTFGLAKRDFNRSALFNLEETLDYEAHIQDVAGRAPEHKEGVRAFLEKRTPDYRQA